jgi:hypothetical protein
MQHRTPGSDLGICFRHLLESKGYAICGQARIVSLQMYEFMLVTVIQPFTGHPSGKQKKLGHMPQFG